MYVMNHYISMTDQILAWSIVLVMINGIMITLYRFDFEYIQMLQREYLIVVRYFIADGGCSRDLFSVVCVFVLIKLNQDKISQVTIDKQCTKDLNDDD